MNSLGKYLTKAVAIGSLIAAPMTALAGTGDTSKATISLSANVPEVFSVTARGVSGDLDLTPNVIVVNRPIGVLHFKYNEDIASLKITTTNASGMPEKGGTAYSFAAGTYKMGFGATCTPFDSAKYGSGGTQGFIAVADITGAADLKTLVALGTSGVETDCTLDISYTGTNAALPRAGVYSVTYTITMVAN